MLVGRPEFQRLSLRCVLARPDPDLSWISAYLSRDMGSGSAEPKPDTPAHDKPVQEYRRRPYSQLCSPSHRPPRKPTSPYVTFHIAGPAAVAEWLRHVRDCLGLSREALKEASGIKIPTSSFVLKIILAYIITLVPLNWVICRYIFNRRELAWIVVPLLSIGFAIGVERLAAYDVGYNSACDEIDLLETHAGYPRAHVSRFGSLYSTGRIRYTISYPNDPTALALPLNNGLALRGEDVTTSIWQSVPTPSLEGYLIQPRN